jgi:hypothetical protein
MSMRKVSGLVLWILLGMVVVIVPIACGTATLTTGGPPSDASPSDMTATSPTDMTQT